MKEIKNYSYSYVEGELTIFVEDLNGREYSVATISDVKYRERKQIAEEVLEELGYQIVKKKNMKIRNLKEKYKEYLKSIWEHSKGTIKESYYFYLQDIKSSKLENKDYFPSTLEEILSDEGFLEDSLNYYIENEPEFIEEQLKQ